MNVTDDAALNHTSPGAIDAPIVGAGATTTIEDSLVTNNSHSLMLLGR